MSGFCGGHDEDLQAGTARAHVRSAVSKFFMKPSSASFGEGWRPKNNAGPEESGMCIEVYR